MYGCRYAPLVDQCSLESKCVAQGQHWRTPFESRPSLADFGPDSVDPNSNWACFEINRRNAATPRVPATHPQLMESPEPAGSRQPLARLARARKSPPSFERPCLTGRSNARCQADPGTIGPNQAQLGRFQPRLCTPGKSEHALEACKVAIAPGTDSGNALPRRLDRADDDTHSGDATKQVVKARHSTNMRMQVAGRVVANFSQHRRVECSRGACPKCAYHERAPRAHFPTSCMCPECPERMPGACAPSASPVCGETAPTMLPLVVPSSKANLPKANLRSPLDVLKCGRSRCAATPRRPHAKSEHI